MNSISIELPNGIARKTRFHRETPSSKLLLLGGLNFGILKRMTSLGVKIWRKEWWTSPLVQAFGLSLLIHVELFCVLEIGIYKGWWQASMLPDWLQAISPQAVSKPTQKTVKVETLQFPNRIQPEDSPLLYVEVDPTLSTIESPPQASFYSARNSLAANPDAAKETAVPKVDGKQTKIVKTVDTLRPNPKTVNAPDPRPVAPPKKAEDPAPPAKPEIKPEPKPLVEPQPKADPGKSQEQVVSGDTQVGTPQPKRAEPSPAQEASSPPTRRRTLPPEKRQLGLLAGEKMRQDGGVKRRALVSSLNVKESPFGNYDEQVIIAIQQRWFDLLEQDDYTRGRTGKVALEFRMTSDGRVIDMRVGENDVGELLAIICQRAVLDPAPYAPWPAEMKRKIGGNYREVRFTFYYE